MKKVKIFNALAAVALLIVFSNCKKAVVQPELNINYKAAFVVNGASTTISVVDLATETVKATIPFDGNYPHHIYLSPDKTKFAIAFTGQDLSGGHAGHGSGSAFKVVVVDAVKGQNALSLDLTAMPHNAVFSPDGSELWLGQSDATASKVLILNALDLKEKARVTVGKGLSEVTFSADGSKVYAANTTDNTVSVINPTTKAVTTTIPVGAAPVGAWTATNGKMYVDNETAQTVSEIDVATSAITATINLGFKPGYVAYNAILKELWVSDATNGKVVYYKLVNNVWAKQGDFATGADAHAIAFSKDGAKAYVTNQGAQTVSIVTAATHTKVKDIAVGDKPNGVVLTD